MTLVGCGLRNLCSSPFSTLRHQRERGTVHSIVIGRGGREDYLFPRANLNPRDTAVSVRWSEMNRRRRIQGEMACLMANLMLKHWERPFSL
jgi:hypothetical protein